MSSNGDSRTRGVEAHLQPTKRYAPFELASYDVHNAVAGRETRLDGGTLTVDVEELRRMALAVSELFADVRVDIIKPGDDVRVVHAVDAAEPRIRVSAPETDFPGMLSVASATVGEGRTNRLRGVGVVVVGEPMPGEPVYWREAIFDMAGEAAAYSPFGGLIDVVLTFVPNLDLLPPVEALDNLFLGTPGAVEYSRAMRVAELRVAVALARATLGLEPDEVKTYDLVPTASEDLPTIVYLFQTSMPFVYGEVVPGGGEIGDIGHLPTIIHPTEVLDGALVNSWAINACMRDTTYLLQNHAVVENLYARHGRDLDFGGVVLYTNGDSVETKERISSYAANVARQLGADGVVLNYLGGGHAMVDVMLACQKLEQHGIRTTLLLMEMADQPEDPGFVHFVREADAIVSTGNYEQTVRLPHVGCVLGGTHILPTGEDAQGPLELTLRRVLASTNQYGGSSLRGRTY